MNRKDFGPEISVGILVLVGLIVLAYMSIRLGGVRLGTETGYRVSAVFNSVSGLVKDSPVEIAGIEIGRVKDVSLKDDKAKVEMLISPNVVIGKDALAMVRTKGVLGDKFIEIRQADKGPPLPPGGTIARTTSPPDLDEVLADVGPLVQDVQGAAAGLKEFLGSKKGQADFRAILSDLRGASASIKNISGDVESGKGTLGRLVKDDSLYVKAEETMGTLQDVAQKVAKGQGTLGKLVQNDELYNKARDTIDSLHGITEKIAKGEGTLGKLVTDESFFNKADKAMGSLQSVAEKVDKGEGTLGKLVNDPTLYDEAKKALNNVNKAAAGLEEEVPVTILGTVVGVVLR